MEPKSEINIAKQIGETEITFVQVFFKCCQHRMHWNDIHKAR